MTGDLKDAEGKSVKPLVLSKTKYLPSLEGKRWSKSSPGADDEISESAKLILKRARLDLKIVLNKSDESSKYELFQRLNTGGSLATEQEVRNCILIMLNKTFFDWVSQLGRYASFRNCIPLSERQIEEQYDLELVVRFLVLKELPLGKLVGRNDLGQEATAFKKTFDLLDGALGEDAFKKFNTKKDKATGPLLISLFEVFALGIGHHCQSPNFTVGSAEIKNAQKSIWKNRKFIGGTGSGVGPINRLPVTLALGRDMFQP